MGSGYSSKMKTILDLQIKLNQQKKTLLILSDYSENQVKDFRNKEIEEQSILQELQELKANIESQQPIYESFKIKFQLKLQNFQQEIQKIDRIFDPRQNQQIEEVQHQPGFDQVINQKINKELEEVMLEVSKIEQNFTVLQFRAKCQDGEQRIQQFKQVVNEMKGLENKINQNIKEIRLQEKKNFNFGKQISQKNTLKNVIEQKDQQIVNLCCSMLQDCKEKLMNLEYEFGQNEQKKQALQNFINESLNQEQQQLNQLVNKRIKLKSIFNQKLLNIKSESIELFKSEFTELDIILQETEYYFQTNVTNEKLNQSQDLIIIQESIKRIEKESQSEYEFCNELAKTFKIDLKNGSIYYYILTFYTTFSFNLEKFQNQTKELINKEKEYQRIQYQKIILGNKVENFQSRMNAVLKLIKIKEQKNQSELKERQQQELQETFKKIKLEIIQLERKYQDKQKEVEYHYLEKEKCQKKLEEVKEECDKYQQQNIRKLVEIDEKYQNNLTQIIQQQENIEYLRRMLEQQEFTTKQFQQTLNNCKQSNYEVEIIITKLQQFIEDCIFQYEREQTIFTASTFENVQDQIVENQNEINIKDFGQILESVKSLERKFKQNSENIQELKCTLKTQQNQINFQNQIIECLESQLKQTKLQLETVSSQVEIKQNIIQFQQSDLQRNENLLKELQNEKISLNLQIQKLEKVQQALLNELKSLREKDNYINIEKQRQQEMQIKLIEYKKQLENLNNLSEQNDIQAERQKLILEAKQNLFKRENEKDKINQTVSLRLRLSEKSINDSD